ncbi:unnamed protein product [Closterium sp. Yama58-4]|nr:unnamed protein product [Closterium sp. Yama58-4]
MAVARRATVHPSGIAQECSTTYPMLESHLKKSGAEKDGHYYCIYYFFTPLLTRMELGVPFKLSSPDKTVPEDSANGIIVVDRPDVNAAAMWHIGPYQKLGDTYKALCEWIRSQGKSPGSLMFEEYYTNPMEEKDPAKYRTRVAERALAKVLLCVLNDTEARPDFMGCVFPELRHVGQWAEAERKR